MVLPNPNVSGTATHAGPPAHAGPAAHAPGDAHGKNRIVAFFAKTVDDQKIDVHQEGQQMMRVIENAGGVWECKIHPQPTLNDLHHAIASANPCNMRGMHVAGHSRKKCGFIWNKDDAARESEQFDVKAVALAIGAVAGKNGPLEFVYLSACETELMGRLLRKYGVPYVVCWLTPVQDETARKFCFFFYRALVEDASGARDYPRRAFSKAVDDMRALLKARQGTGEMDQCGSASARARDVLPGQQIDIVMLLSQDGDRSCWLKT